MPQRRSDLAFAIEGSLLSVLKWTDTAADNYFFQLNAIFRDLTFDGVTIRKKERETEKLPPLINITPLHAALSAIGPITSPIIFWGLGFFKSIFFLPLIKECVRRQSLPQQLILRRHGTNDSCCGSRVVGRRRGESAHSCVAVVEGRRQDAVGRRVLDVVRAVAEVLVDRDVFHDILEGDQGGVWHSHLGYESGRSQALNLSVFNS